MAHLGRSTTDLNCGHVEQLEGTAINTLSRHIVERMTRSDVLIIGLGGLGAEIAKNVILSGVKSVTLSDTNVTTQWDLSSQFYLSERCLGMNRAEACCSSLAELNCHVPVRVLATPLTGEILQRFQVIVLTESPLEEQIRISEFAHAKNIPIVIASTAGLFGHVFCDFGEGFTVFDTTGGNCLSAKIATISQETEGVVTTIDKFGHGFEDDDYVQFSEVEGMTELNGKMYKVKVLGPFIFSIGDTSSFSPYEDGGVATQVKIPKTMTFKKLSESLNSPTFVLSDPSKSDRAKHFHVAFKALHEFYRHENRLPEPGVPEDRNIFLYFCRVLRRDLEIDKDLMRRIANACCGNLAPIVAIIGGIAAQEVIKACSGQFLPINQWLFMDALECLPEDWDPAREDVAPLESRYDGQISVFGRDFQRKLQKQRYLIAGASEIGCELLKNLALMGVGCGKEDGEINVADTALIKESNMNRHPFLFQFSDLTQPKAIVATRAVRAINPDLNAIPHVHSIEPSQETIYDEGFFDRMDVVINTMEDSDTAIYMNRRCIVLQKPLLELAALGTKGSTQILIPFLTESHFSPQEHPLGMISNCTRKYFPHAIEHTLYWARDTFEGLFYRMPDQASQYLNDINFLRRIIYLQGVQPVDSLESVLKILIKDRPHNFEDCVTWARLNWEENFSNQIRELLFFLPRDYVDEGGNTFWWPPRQCPHPLTFDINNELHIDYVFAAANLRADIYGIPRNLNRAAVIEMIQNVTVPPYNLLSALDRNVFRNSEQEHQSDTNNEPFSVQTMIMILLLVLPRQQLLRENFQVRPLHFDKDDDSNLHMDFIVAASNLRALNYDITPADRVTSKLIVGKIISVVASTTSIVAGLACLELIKLAQGIRSLEMYKNCSVNLALPFFAFSEPVAASKMKYNDTEWSSWDRFEIQGELTLQELLRHFKNEYGLEIMLLSHAGYMLYSSFKTQTDIEELMTLSMSEIVRRKSKKGLEHHVRSLIFQICCIDQKGNNVEVPYIFYMRPFP